MMKTCRGEVNQKGASMLASSGPDMADCHARINGEKPAWIKLGLVLGHPPHDTNLERLNIWLGGVSAAETPDIG